MNEYWNIMNDVFKDNDNIVKYTIDELVDVSTILSKEGDNGRAIKLCEMILEYYLPKYEAQPSLWGEDILTVYLHHGSFLELLGFAKLAFSSFTKAIQIAKHLKEFLSEKESAKYTALCYHFMGSHYMREGNNKNAMGCYQYICDLLDEYRNDEENDLLFRKSMAYLEELTCE